MLIEWSFYCDDHRENEEIDDLEKMLRFLSNLLIEEDQVIFM